MAKVNPNSRASQVRTAESVLAALLKKPKTRNGLVAAVTSRMISRRFVFGWLANQVVSGGVVKLKSGDIVTYQVKGKVIVETPAISGYPSWLDPRALPTVTERKVFIDGRQVDPDQVIQPRKTTI
jgi:hypothetical protein